MPLMKGFGCDCWLFCCWFAGWPKGFAVFVLVARELAKGFAVVVVVAACLAPNIDEPEGCPNSDMGGD